MQPVLPVTQPDSAEGIAYWNAAEDFRRSLLGKELPAEFYAQRDAIQQRWIREAQTIESVDFPAFFAACLQEEAAFYEKWKQETLHEVSCAAGFKKRWAKKNTARNK